MEGPAESSDPYRNRPDLIRREPGEKHQLSALPNSPQKFYGRPIGNPAGTQMEEQIRIVIS